MWHRMVTLMIPAFGMALCLLYPAAAAVAADTAPARMDEALAKDWLSRWEKNILGDMKSRYCDKEVGEEIGWLVSPFVSGFYHGYMATGETRWIDALVDWSDAVVKRGVKEPDGYVGWPKAGGASTSGVPDFITDNQLGEAMLLRPMVLMAGEIRRTPTLKARYAAKAEEYIRLSEQMFEKWDSRGAWRQTKEGGLWVVPPFGLSARGDQWTEGYEQRKAGGFSLPANKQNAVALWMLAMHDVTGKAVYRERAQKWFAVMKSRMRLSADGKYFVWNYWDIGGPWDSRPDGTPKHWIGVHPNGGYYSIGVEGIVAAYEHGLVFTKADMDRLVATNRDFMWNREIKGAQFQRIDGGKPDKRWAKSPGVLWAALVPHDPVLRKIFEANHNPAGWGGLASTPRHLARFAPAPRAQ